MDPDDPAYVPLDELAARAERARVAVIGGGVAGLVAALECAKVGVHVTLFEADARLGGTVHTVMLDGLPVDVGADGFSARGDAVPRLVAQLGLTDDVVTPSAAGRHVFGVPGASGPLLLPDDAVLGIPENVWSDAARAVLGAAGTWRAYLDRLRPPMTIGHERSLGRLVRSRMGDKALQRLVAPVTAGVFFADADDIDVDVAARGLNNALTRAGSLSGAVGMLRGAHAHAQAPEFRGLRGGMSRLVDAAAGRLAALGADTRCDARVTALEQQRGTGWIVHTTADEFDVTDEAPDVFDGVIVATPEVEARRLLGDAVPDLAAPASGVAVQTVTLVVDASGADASAVAAEVVAVPGTARAASVLHETARWPWLAAAAGSDRRVVRVVFAHPHAAPVIAGLDDDAAVAMACAEASVMLGVPIAPGEVRAAHRAVFTAAPAQAVMGRAAQAGRARAAVGAVAGLAVTGAWLCGGGLAQVVPDAVQAAERLRRRALFGDRTPS